MLSQYQPHREWEYINFPVELFEINCIQATNLFSPDSILTVWRNEDFKLAAKISGFTMSRFSLENQTDEGPGSFAKEETVEALTTDRMSKFTLYGCLIKNVRSKGIIYQGIGMPFEADLLFDSITNTPVHTAKGAEITAESEWFLSRQFQAYFPRSTERELNHRYIRSRISNEEEPDTGEGYIRGGTKDHFEINSGGLKCIVGLVPKAFGPEWATGVAIEYRRDFGFIESQTIKEAIQNLTGFLLGTELLHIGTTKYAKNTVVQSIAHSPLISGVQQYCSQGTLYPIQLNTKYEWGKIEWLVNTLLPTYLELLEPLRLNDVMWRYFQARENVIGANLPILASALEGLADRWLKMKNIPEHYLPKQEYEEMIESELQKLREKLAHVPGHDKLIGKIEHAWSRGSNEKIVQFFELICG